MAELSFDKTPYKFVWHVPPLAPLARHGAGPQASTLTLSPNQSLALVPSVQQTTDLVGALRLDVAIGATAKWNQLLYRRCRRYPIIALQLCEHSPAARPFRFMAV